MSRFEIDYQNLVSTIIMHGEHRQSRAGFTNSIFGTSLSISCLEVGDFPLLTQRKIFTKGIFGELAAFLCGATTLEAFKHFGCNYWDANAAAWHYNEGLAPEKYSVGNIYGAQWRDWAGCIDQLAVLVKNLVDDPYSRRHLLTTYDPAELDTMCLPPCHLLAQYNVRTTKRLDCIIYMRSVDVCLGLPSDVALYAALLLILCKQTGYLPGKLVFMLGDSHIYKNHIDLFQEQVSRPMHALPQYALHECSIDNFEPDALGIMNYQHSGVMNYALNN